MYDVKVYDLTTEASRPPEPEPEPEFVTWAALAAAVREGVNIYE